MRKITMVGIPKDIMTVGIKGNYWTEASVSLKRSLSNSSETKVHRRPMSAYNEKSPKRKISRKQSRNPPGALWQQPCDQALPSKLPSLVVVYWALAHSPPPTRILPSTKLPHSRESEIHFLGGEGILGKRPLNGSVNEGWILCESQIWNSLVSKIPNFVH